MQQKNYQQEILALIHSGLPQAELAEKLSDYHENDLADALAAPPSSANVPFHKGDLVEHTAFGRGMIVSLKPMGGDALLEVAFDSVGTKKLMLKAASQHMKKA